MRHTRRRRESAPKGDKNRYHARQLVLRDGAACNPAAVLEALKRAQRVKLARVCARAQRVCRPRGSSGCNEAVYPQSDDADDETCDLRDEVAMCGPRQRPCHRAAVLDFAPRLAPLPLPAQGRHVGVYANIFCVSRFALVALLTFAPSPRGTESPRRRTSSARAVSGAGARSCLPWNPHAVGALASFPKNVRRPPGRAQAVPDARLRA